MTWIAAAVIIFLLIAGALVASAVAATTARDKNAGENTRAGARVASIASRVVAVVLALIWVLLTVLGSFHEVKAGNVGVVYQFGDIVGQTGAGLQFIPPWQTMEIASVQVQRSKFENISGFSKETQDVAITVSLNYSVSPQAVQSLYRKVGPNWFSILIEPRVINFFKEETVKYSSVEVAPHREEIRLAVKARLAEDLRQYSIDVNDLLIDNIDFDKAFKTAIEQKQIAAQDALREEQRVQQKKHEAEQVIETAKGQAQATRELALGQADANRELAKSLTPEVIQFQALQKLADKLQIAILPSGQGLIIDPAQLLKGAAATTPPAPAISPPSGSPAPK